jgi:hypothetical protein
MKNPFTGTPMELVRQRQSIMFRGEEVFYEHIGFEAIEGDCFTTTEQDTYNMESALREYHLLKGNESNFKEWLIGVLLLAVFLMIIL